MRRSLFVLSALVLGCAAAIAACSDDASEPATALPSDDAGTSVPGARPDADAPVDAGADAKEDAAPRTCSDEGFCTTNHPAGTAFRAVWGDGAGTVWAVSSSGDVLRWSAGTWNVHTSVGTALRAVWGTGPLDVWVGGDGGIWHGTGATAATLTFQASALPQAGTRITSIWGAAANDVWAVGSYEDKGATIPRVLRYTGPKDAGSSWTVDAVSSKGIAFSSVWGSAASGVWLAGSRPQPAPDDYLTEVAVLRRRPSTTTFVEQVLPTDPNEDPVFGRLASFGGATVASDTQVLVLGTLVSSVPGIWRGTAADAGAFSFTYERIGRSNEPPILAVTSTGPNDVWAAGGYGRLRRWDGTTFTQAAITVTKYPVTKDLHGLWAGAQGELWVVGDDVALRRAPK